MRSPIEVSDSKSTPNVDRSFRLKEHDNVERLADHGHPSGIHGYSENNSSQVSLSSMDKTNSDGWQTPHRSKFKEPDVLIVGNSNIRGLSPRFLQPLFVVKHILDDKTMRGAAKFLQSTDICPRKSIIIQAIDNDIGTLPNADIVSKLEQIIRICNSRFPGVDVHLVEPLGRCCDERPGIYWRNADLLCDMISSVTGLKVIKISNMDLKRAGYALFKRERGGFIHLNDKGINALSNVYKDYFTKVNTHVDIQVSKSCGRDRVTRVADRNNRLTEHGDGSLMDCDDRDRFGLLVRTLIKSLSSFG